MHNLFFETLQTINKTGNTSDNLLSKVMASGLQTYLMETNKYNLEELLEFLYKSTDDQSALSFSDRRDMRAELVDILEDLRIPLKSSQIHYLIAGIDSVTAALDLSKQQSQLKFSDLLKMISFFSIQAAALSVNDAEVARNDLFDEILEFVSVAEFREKYVEFQKVIYPLSLILICDRLIDTKMQKCTELVDFLKYKKTITVLSNAIEEVGSDNPKIQAKSADLTKKINDLQKREEELRNSTFINLLKSDVISGIIFNDKFKQELRSLCDKQGVLNKPHQDVFASPLSSLLYRSKELSSVRLKLTEIFGSIAFSDTLIKSVVQKCSEISTREKSIQQRIGFSEPKTEIAVVGV
jgi:hypothetical protein